MRGRCRTVSCSTAKFSSARRRPQPFALLQKRVNAQDRDRERSARSARGVHGLRLAELNGEDFRCVRKKERRAALEQLADEHEVLISPRVAGGSWQQLAVEREQSRARGVEGLMIKHLESRYRVGRTKEASGNWWKWKIDPYAVDAVLVYAQRGHGRRASLYSDYTFAVWTSESGVPERALVPFYQGLFRANRRGFARSTRRFAAPRTRSSGRCAA